MESHGRLHRLKIQLDGATTGDLDGMTDTLIRITESVRWPRSAASTSRTSRCPPSPKFVAWSRTNGMKTTGKIDPREDNPTAMAKSEEGNRISRDDAAGEGDQA